MLRAGLQTLLVTLLPLMAITPLPARQRPHHSRPAKLEQLIVTVRAPCIRSDGKQHDRLEDFDSEELKRIPAEKKQSFLQEESPPDLAVLVVRIDAEEPYLIACTQNQHQVAFSIASTSEPYGLVILDRDGDGQLRLGRFPDVIGGVIVTPNELPPSKEQRDRLTERMINGMRKLGVQSIEFATQRRTGSQIPRSFPTVTLKECQVTECHPNGKDGMSLAFDLAEVSASQGNLRHYRNIF